jgi:hypothetical protein
MQRRHLDMNVPVSPEDAAFASTIETTKQRNVCMKKNAHGFSSLQAVIKIILFSSCIGLAQVAMADSSPTLTENDHLLSVGERFSHLMADAGALGASVFSSDTKSPNTNSFWFASPEVEIEGLSESVG